jgi:RNA polymerase sigma-70 factor (ECF subfamily)
MVDHLERPAVLIDATDRASLARAAAGDPDAFRVLVDRHSRYVFSVAYRLTGSVEDAEDVVQNTFLKAHRQLNRFEARADVKTWLHRITVNASIDLIRSRRHREVGHDPADLEAGSDRADSLDRVPGPERLVMSAEIRDRLKEGLTLLTPSERAAFTLRHVEGLSIREVAAAMGLKTEAAKNSIFRAVRKMRAALEPLVTATERQS